MSDMLPRTGLSAGRVAAPLAALAAVVGPAVGPALGLRGSVGDVFVNRGDPLLPPGWAFAIWGPLYAGCVVAGAWVGLGRSEPSRAVQWPMAATLVCLSGWPAAAQAGMLWVTVVLILAAVACSWTTTLRLATGQRSGAGQRLDRWLLLYPMAALSGWLTVATGVNGHAWARQVGLANAADWVQGVVAVAVLAGLAVAVVVMWRGLRGGPGVRSFSLPVVWGLGAVAVGLAGGLAEGGDRVGTGLAWVVGGLAGGLAAATGVGAVVVRWWWGWWGWWGAGGDAGAVGGGGGGGGGIADGAQGLVLFDGGCGLCHASVRVLLRLDRRGALAFAPLEGETARAVLDAATRAGLPDSVVYVALSGGRAAGGAKVRTAAVAAALRACGGVGAAAGAVLGWMAGGWSDAMYDAVAARRRRWFKPPTDACPVPPARARGRLLP